MKKLLKSAIAVLMLCFILVGCGKNKEPKEWTYELLEKEFGGIIKVGYDELTDCLKLLSQKRYWVYGYVREYDSSEFMGHDISHIKIADNKEENKYERRLYVGCDVSDLKNLSVGDLICAKGSFLAKVDYSENDYLYQISADRSVSRKKKDDKNYITVGDFYSLMDKIYCDTFFEVEGVIIKDGDRYFLYKSEEAYKENKLRKISIEFSEPQSNLNGKNVLIIGKPELGSVYDGLKECSIVKEK